MVALPPLEDQIALISQSGFVHREWYLNRYPDVRHLGMRASEHYLRYGAEMGRDPGYTFSSDFYVETNPEILQTGINPLVHYLLVGRAEGREIMAPGRLRKTDPEDRIRPVRGRLLSLGLTGPALAEFRALTRDEDETVAALAELELGLWRLREATPEGWRACLEHLARAKAAPLDAGRRSSVMLLRLICLYHLGDADAARDLVERARTQGILSPDVLLAWANFRPPAERMFLVNRVLAAYGLAPLRFVDGTGPLYDRLAPERRAPPERGPLVTVLVAAHDAAGTLPTALRSLREQTWRDLEILVIDDASPDDGATVAAAERAARDDPRIRVLRMARNGGAYVARNRGLDEARGQYVTIHDADDWSHPEKIARQVRYLERHPDVIGCTSQQARATDGMVFRRWTGRGRLIIQNTSSFMFRREPVREALGYWDTVRFAADSEFIRRIRRTWGPGATVDLGTGPLSFQRDSAGSAVADTVAGMNGFYYGVRKEYFDAQRHHFRTAESLRYDGDPDRRPYPVPAMMRPERRELLARPRRFDLVVAGDFRRASPAHDALLDRAEAAAGGGARVGLVELYDPEGGDGKMATERTRTLIATGTVEVLVFGDEVATEELRMSQADHLLVTRYAPGITADRVVKLSEGFGSEGAPAVTQPSAT